MIKYKLKLLLITVTLSNSVLFSQNGFDYYLSKDSLYRYNSSAKIIDSLLNFKITESARDTSFYSSYGRAEVINLSQLLFFAVNNNPEIKSIEHKIESLDFQADEKSYLPDPMLEAELDNIMSDFKRVGMINFFVSQMFPFPGKLGLEKKSVLNNKSMFESEKLDMAVSMMNMVKMNYYELYFINHKLSINQNNQLIVKTFITAAESKYTVGKGMQQEVFKAQIELSRLINEEFVLNQERKNKFSELTKLTKVNINENTRINFSDIDPSFLLKTESFDFNENETNKLIDYALENRADLKTLRNKIIMNKTDIEMSKLSRMPDFSIRLGYKILPFEERNAFSVMVGVNIPFAPWSSGKYGSSIKKTELNLKSTTDEYEAKRIETRNEIVSIVNNIKSIKETINYYHGVLIPQTENTLKSTQYSYETNMTDFLDLLDSYRMYQDANLMYFESLTMYLKMIAELEKATGINLKN
ncbi:MAG: TolC family protein [Chlorobi bacterium]|nr:TolC family protein [Chlorobiota bacterium]MCI0715500.1 TolC family protein [Chlorobiota bacterium]